MKRSSPTKSAPARRTLTWLRGPPSEDFDARLEAERKRVASTALTWTRGPPIEDFEGVLRARLERVVRRALAEERARRRAKPSTERRLPTGVPLTARERAQRNEQLVLAQREQLRLKDLRIAELERAAQEAKRAKRAKRAESARQAALRAKAKRRAASLKGWRTRRLRRAELTRNEAGYEGIAGQTTSHPVIRAQHTKLVAAIRDQADVFVDYIEALEEEGVDTRQATDSFFGPYL